MVVDFHLRRLLFSVSILHSSGVLRESCWGCSQLAKW